MAPKALARGDLRLAARLPSEATEWAGLGPRLRRCLTKPGSRTPHPPASAMREKHERILASKAWAAR